MSYTPIPNPLPISGSVDLAGEAQDEMRSLSTIMEEVLIELKLLNLHLHELPRALNDGYSFLEDDESARLDFMKEI